MSDQPLKYFFQVNTANMERFEQRSVYFTKPRLVALYNSIYGKLSPAKTIKYLRLPSLSEYPIDLKEAFTSYRFLQPTSNIQVMVTLKPTMLNAEAEASADEGRSNDRVGRTAVYTRRGTLRYIMQFCYNVPGDLTLLVSRQNDQLYMFELYSDLEESMRKPEFTHHGRLTQYLFVDKPKNLPNLEEPCDDNITLCTVHSSRLGIFDITYGGEAQGINSDDKIDIGDDVSALNGKRFVLSKQMWSELRNKDTKFLNYWLQAYLANVDDIYLAYKDNQAVVREPIQHLKVSNIPKNRYWKPGVCTAFLNEFLERVVQIMWNVNSFQTVYEFHFKAKDKTIHYQIHEGKRDKMVIPKEYMEFVKTQIKK